VNRNEDHVSFDVLTSQQPAASSTRVACSITTGMQLNVVGQTTYYVHIFSHMNPVTQSRCAALKLACHSSLASIQIHKTQACSNALGKATVALLNLLHPQTFC
jgi:hypothetical protein